MLNLKCNKKINPKLYSIIYNFSQIILAILVFFLFSLISLNYVDYLDILITSFGIIILFGLVISLKKGKMRVSLITVCLLFILSLVLIVIPNKIENYKKDNDFKFKEYIVRNRKKCNEQETINSANLCTLPIIRDDGASGTGLSIYKGFLITNRHVIANANKIYTLFNNRSLETTELKVWNYSDSIDIAILKLPRDIPTCKWFSSENLKLAEDLYVLGWPTDVYGQATITKGEFYNVSGTDEYMTYIQTNANVNPGNSGSTLINECGVVGIIKSKIIDDYGNFYEGNSNAIGSEKLIPLVIKLIEEGNENKGIPRYKKTRY